MFVLLCLLGYGLVILITLITIFGRTLEVVNVYLILFFWLVSNVLDVHSTFICLGTKRGRENNPIARLFMKIFGQKAGLIVLKAGLLIWFTPLLMKGSRTAFISWTILIFMVVAHNYYLYRKLRVRKVKDACS